MQRSSIYLALILLASLDWVTACSHPEQQPAIERLVDRGAASFSLIADDTWRATLDPEIDEHRFPIADARRGTRLLFFPGLARESSPGSVLFEVTWRSGSQAPTTIYKQTLSEPGWAEGVVALPSAGPGELVLRKGARKEQRGVLSGAGWGNPTLLFASSPTRPSVILISLDTLRADRLGFYGRREARTPVLDAFMRDAVRYDQAYSPSTWTRPSHQAMLFGVQASALPATTQREKVKSYELESFESLAAAFRKAGYLTAAFTGGGFVRRSWGMGSGFDVFYEYTAPPAEPGTCPETRFDGAEVFARAQRWLRARAAAPFFLFVHTYDPHDRCPVNPKPHRKPAANFTPAQRAALIHYYDDVVARADALVGDLLHELSAVGLEDSALVVITSDHGEELWEHGQFGHGCGPAYEGLAHVPLALRLPHAARRGERIDVPVSTVDVAPTLLALTETAIPGSMQGRVLPGLGLAPDAERPVYVFCGDWLSVRKGDLKFIVSRRLRKRMLFDVAADPSELVDLVKERNPAEDELRALAQRYWPHPERVAQVETGKQAEQDLDPADAERLRVLGYTE